MHFDRLKRRKFIALLGGAAALPLAARAQPTPPIIGWISVIGVPEYIARAFRQGLGELGYIDGRNVLVEFQSADGQYDRLPALAADLVRRQVSLIATSGNAAVLAAEPTNPVAPNKTIRTLISGLALNVRCRDVTHRWAAQQCLIRMVRLQ